MGRAAGLRDRLKSIATVILPLLIIFGCATPSSPPPPPVKAKHAHHTPPHVTPPAEETYKLDSTIFYPPGAYMLHLSLAELTLEAGKGDGLAASADFDIARAYSQQGQTGDVLQPTIIIEYSLKDAQERKNIAIPFTMPKQTSEFASLEEVMKKLSNLSYTVYDLRLGVVRMSPPQPFPALGGDTASSEKLAADTLKPLLKSAFPLPPMAQARVYLQLARFFMKHRYKESAYLAIENARQSLAMVNDTFSQDTSETGRNLTREIDAEEALLHKTMPFTLNF